MPTITGIATSNDDFSILVAALQYLDAELDAGLVNTLNDAHQHFTVFAPTNTAFANLATNLGYGGDPSDTAAVTAFLVGNIDAKVLLDVVLYHVSPTAQLSGDIAAHPTIATLNGATIHADLPTLVDNEPDLIDPSLTSVDNIASNGVVHIIDQVLLPIDLPGNDAPTIAGIVASSGDGFDSKNRDFDILLEAAKTAGLVGVLDDAHQDLTVFAPRDGAFINLAQDLGYKGSDEAKAWAYLVEALTLLGGGDPIPLLTQVLFYHVSGESLQASQVLSSDEIETLQGGSLGVSGASLVDAEPDLADPNIVATDIQAANGVVHVIDGVLLPADLLQSDGSDDVDFIIAGGDDDRIRTGKDADFVDGNGGDDRISTGKGQDVALGGTGEDRIFLGKGDDLALGGKGKDDMIGGRGDDELKGEGGRDVLFGRAGDDRLEGGNGHDMLIGGRGEDVFVFNEGDDKDTILGFNTAKDKIDLSSYELSGFDDISDGIESAKPGTSIDLGNGDSIFLAGLSGARLDEDNFIF